MDVGAGAGDDDGVDADGIGGAQHRPQVPGLLDTFQPQHQGGGGEGEAGQVGGQEGRHPQHPVGALADGQLAERSLGHLDHLAGFREGGSTQLRADDHGLDGDPGRQRPRQFPVSLDQEALLAAPMAGRSQPPQVLDQRIGGRGDALHPRGEDSLSSLMNASSRRLRAR